MNPDDPTLARLLALTRIDQVLARGDRDAPCVSFEGRHWTYAGFDRHVDDAAQALRAAGVQPGDRLALLCTNMKNAGIVIYTVRVEVKTGSSSLLQNCATTPEMFYDVQSASNLSAVFSAIAGSIENLRITQ